MIGPVSKDEIRRDERGQGENTFPAQLTTSRTGSHICLLPTLKLVYYKNEDVLSLQPMIPPKRFDIFFPLRGMLRRSRCVQIIL